MSQQYLLPCSCGQKICVANAQAGGQVACSCGKLLSVPTLRGLRELELAPQTSDARAQPGWSRLQGIIFVIGLLAAAIGLCVVAFYSWRYAQLTLQGSHWLIDRTEDVVKAQSAEVSAMSPTSLLDEWSKVKAEGLGEPSKPIWVTAKEAIQRYQSRIAAGAITLGAGALLAVCALFLGRAPSTALKS